MASPPDENAFDIDREIRALRWRGARKAGMLLLVAIAFCAALVAVTDLMVNLAKSTGSSPNSANPAEVTPETGSSDRPPGGEEEGKNKEFNPPSKTRKSATSLPAPPRLEDPPRLE